MTLTEATATLIKYNKWRRGDEMSQPSPIIIGQAIDIVTDHLCKQEKQKWFNTANSSKLTASSSK